MTAPKHKILFTLGLPNKFQIVNHGANGFAILSQLPRLRFVSDPNI